jgi:hypothetical protein
MKFPVVGELHAHRLFIPVEEDPRRRGVEHYVEVVPVAGGPEEGPGCREAGAVARRRLGDRESCVCSAVQVDGRVAYVQGKFVFSFSLSLSLSLNLLLLAPIPLGHGFLCYSRAFKLVVFSYSMLLPMAPESSFTIRTK